VFRHVRVVHNKRRLSVCDELRLSIKLVDDAVRVMFADGDMR